MAAVQLADIVIPELFLPYQQQVSEIKSRLVRSGAVVRDDFLDDFLASGGNTVNAPSFKDLDDDAENSSTDDTGSDSVAKKIGTSNEIAVRLDRNQSWAEMDLAAMISGDDPLGAIESRVENYWKRREQALFINTMAGVFADNDAAPTGGDTHIQSDLTVDITGAYAPGVTDFSADAFIDTLLTMGDSEDGLGILMVHSTVFARMKKNNLIDFIVDSEAKVEIPFFQNRLVIKDDSMPKSGNNYESWIFGAGAMRMGVGAPKIATELDRKPASGDGGGQSILHNRVAWSMHPVGHAYIAAGANPSNATLAAAATWSRVFPERKQIKIARLITTEA